SETSVTCIQQPVQDKVVSSAYIKDATLAIHQLANDSSPLSHIITVVHGGAAVMGDIRTFISALEYNDPLAEKLKKDNRWTHQEFALIDWTAYHTAFRRIPRS
ncbi:MAG: hypothetical protein ACK53Y_15475, partial [bacterium]